MTDFQHAKARRRLAGVWVALALAAGPTLAQDQAPRVEIRTGTVEGMTRDGVDIYLGIPYAAPPVGSLRWMLPEPPTAWEGVRPATTEAEYCPQGARSLFAGPSSTNEDCLYLNVYTTGGDSETKKPVIVWVPGGANVAGGGKDYDGSLLATGGPDGVPTVAVTINYRLGLFGFLSESNLNAEGHPFGNYGIMDTQAALRWVQDNIAAFGGDPGNVTIAGQSAGAIDATANILSPASRGLAHRLIAQSIPIGSFYFAPTERATAVGDAFAAAAGCSTAECLRALPVARILQLTQKPGPTGPFIIGPSVDGTIIPMDADTAFRTGEYNMMPILEGSTRDEWGSVIAGEIYDKRVSAGITPEEFNSRNNEEVRALYLLEDYDNNPTRAQISVTTDWFVCMGYRTMALQASTNSFPVYGYEFAYQSPPFFYPQMPNEHDATGLFQPLAAHTADIQFVFPGFHGGHLGLNLDQVTGEPRGLHGDEIRLSHDIVAAWTNFAATGNPNADGGDAWPPYTPEAPVLRVWDSPSNSLTTGPEFVAAHKCDYWNK